MSEPSDPQPVTVSPEVLVQRLPDDELVLLDLATEQYFGLDTTGAAMWAALTEAGDVGGAYAALQERFSVDPEVLRRDLDTFVGQLVERGLVRLGDHAP